LLAHQKKKGSFLERGGRGGGVDPLKIPPSPFPSNEKKDSLLENMRGKISSTTSSPKEKKTTTFTKSFTTKKVIFPVKGRTFFRNLR